MAVTLKHLRTDDPDRRPIASQIVDGQIAINTASGTPGLFFKDENQAIVKVGPVHVGSGAPNSTATTSGNSLGELWFDASVLKIWDGAVWRIASGAFVNNGTLSIASSGSGITGSGTFTANQAGNTSITISSNATSANTVSTIVARDASGNFSAGTVTASGFVSADATSTSLTAGAIKLNGATGAIILDDNGHKRLSWNDGAGNLNLRAGNYFNGTSLVFAKGAADSNGGAASIVFNSDGVDGAITLQAAAIGVPGSAVTFTNSLVLGSTANSLLLNSQQVLHAGNYNSYAPTLTGGGASGSSWGISITGSAATLTTTRTIWGQNFNGSGNVSGALSGATTISASSDITLNGELNFAVAGNKYIDFYTDNDAGALTAAHLRLVNNANTTFHSAITMARGGAVTLFHNNADKLATSSTGVSITGTLTVSSTTLVSNLNADLLDGLNSSDFFRGNDFANTGNIRINNASPTIGLIDTDHATASIHVNANIFYVLRNAANTSSWVQVDGIWPLEINLLNNDAQFGRTVTSQSYQNIVKFSAPWRNNGVTALASSYNYVMTAGNDTGNKLSMFINSSTRTDDGGANALTFRNDGGVLNLGQTGTQTSIFGSQINLSGGSTFYLKNNPAISNGSYAAGNNHIELRTSDGSNPILGFHRAGFTAVALYHDTNNSLRLRDANTGNDSLLWHSTNDGAGSGLDADILSGTIRISAFDFSANTTTQRISAQSGTLFISNSDGAGAGNPISIQRTNVSGNAIRFINVSTQVGTVVINSASTSYNTTSDYRLKENVVPLTGALDRLQLIPVHRFNFTAAPDKTVDGFLAHEVQAFVPEAITGVKDEMEAIGTITDADGNVIQEDVTQPSRLEEGQEWEQTGEQPSYQGIDQSKLVPLLTAAVQELLARVEALESA